MMRFFRAFFKGNGFYAPALRRRRKKNEKISAEICATFAGNSIFFARHAVAQASDRKKEKFVHLILSKLR